MPDDVMFVFNVRHEQVVKTNNSRKLQCESVATFTWPEKFCKAPSAILTLSPRKCRQLVKITIVSTKLGKETEMQTGTPKKLLKELEKKIGKEHENRNLMLRLPLNDLSVTAFDCELSFVVTDRFVRNQDIDVDEIGKGYRLYLKPEYSGENTSVKQLNEIIAHYDNVFVPS